jgi:hypothetical protein
MSALRALEESASMYRRMAERAESLRYEESAQRYIEQAANTSANVKVLRDFLVRVNQGDEEWFDEAS